jgi:hypothetical protein
MAPLISHVYELGLMEAISVPQTECFAAAMQFARTEGHRAGAGADARLAACIREALECKESGEEKVILTALCGHGHFDMAAYDAYLGGPPRRRAGAGRAVRRRPHPTPPAGALDLAPRGAGMPDMSTTDRADRGAEVAPGDIRLGSRRVSWYACTTTTPSCSSTRACRATSSQLHRHLDYTRRHYDSIRAVALTHAHSDHIGLVVPAQPSDLGVGLHRRGRRVPRHRRPASPD